MNQCKPFYIFYRFFLEISKNKYGNFASPLLIDIQDCIWHGFQSCLFQCNLSDTPVLLGHFVYL